MINDNGLTINYLYSSDSGPLKSAKGEDGEPITFKHLMSMLRNRRVILTGIEAVDPSLALAAAARRAYAQDASLMLTDNLIDGRAIAQEVHAETESRVASLKLAGVEPSLMFIRVGEDPASKVYVGMKERTAARLGIRSDTTVLPENTPETELLELLRKLNADASVHGVLVQAPLPVHIDETNVFSAVSPAKDVDGFHPLNAGKLMLGEGGGFVPCTPGGVHELLIRSGVTIEGADVVILGRGNIVGKPMAAILCQKAKYANATVTLCHSRSRDVAKLIAAGRISSLLLWA